MPSEVRIHVDVDATGRYVFKCVVAGARSSSTSGGLTRSSYSQDLRLLRWKSVGVPNPGNLLLNHVGD